MTEYLDIQCGDDIDPSGRDAYPVAVLSQDLYHLVVTPARSLIRDLEWGFGIQNYLSKPLPSSFTTSLENAIRQDDRVSDAKVVLTSLGGDDAGYRLDIKAETDAGWLTIAIAMTPSGIVRLT